MNRTSRLTAIVSAGILALAGLPGWAHAAETQAAGGKGAGHGGTFNGFNEHFNLGQSRASGAVCEAKRGFEDRLVGAGARVWNVTCRGWSQRLGRLYLFSNAKARAAWPAALATRADCGPVGAGASSTTAAGVACKTKPANLDYVVFAPGSSERAIAAEGMAPIADVLAAGLRFLSGMSAEPEAITEQVSDVAGGHISALSLADEAGRSAESRRVEAYRSGQEWQFGDAETAFGELATPAGQGSAAATTRAEALYNLALNVSNKGRFSEADIYFAQGDAHAGDAGAEPGLAGLALNYKAAHARNQSDYAGAIQLADQAIAARAPGERAATAERDAAGAVRIAGVGADDPTARLSPAQRESLRDVQALEIKATSLEALGRRDEARQTLSLATAVLDGPLSAQADPPRRLLGEATPWLNAQVRADRLRLDRGGPLAAQSTAEFRVAVTAFGRKYPNSLPLAGFLLEQARAEAIVAQTDTAQQDKALADYELAFDIFRGRRGSLEASADLVRPYFDILLTRIGAAPANDAGDVTRFFTAAQSLIAQSSAEAAKRQAAQTLAGDQKTAGLARALEDTGRSLDATTGEIRDLQQRGLYEGAAKARIDGERQALAEQSATLEAKLLQADPRYASALRKVVGLDELRKALRPGEVYVKVFLLAGRGYGMLVSQTEATPYAIDLSRDQAAAMVDALRKPIDHLRRLRGGAMSPLKFDVALAHETFAKLLGPVQASVLAARHIIYEPDATVIGVPLAALVIDEASVAVMKTNLEAAQTSTAPLSYVGVTWLGSRIASSTALSASAFVQARAASISKAANPFLGFGDPVISQDPRAFADVRATGLAPDSAQDFCAKVRASLFRMPALPETSEEVRTVASSLGQDASSFTLGAAFTDDGLLRRGAVTGDLSHYKVLYFATHGILPQGQGCMQSALLTSLGEGDSDALLDVRKIPRLNLDADMVVLSACDTGRGANGNSGEALGGLVATFVQAGARNVVVSNWEVDTKATERLMIAMFAAKGASQADALAQAERGLMASPDQYSHPYFWAPFTIVGDGARPMPAV